MTKIHFSHKYYKMPDLATHSTRLLQVLVADSKEFSNEFISYDTTFNGGAYPLPKGKVLILLLFTGDRLWTTIRRWTPQKEKYYKELMRKYVEIVINSSKTEGVEK